MTNTYKWIISQLDCDAQHSTHDKVVSVIHWRRQADDGNGHVGDIYGTQTITFDESASFTPYADLTMDQIITWLEKFLGAETLEAQKKTLDEQVKRRAAPPITTSSLPWA